MGGIVESRYRRGSKRWAGKVKRIAPPQMCWSTASERAARPRRVAFVGRASRASRCTRGPAGAPRRPSRLRDRRASAALAGAGSAAKLAGRDCTPARPGSPSISSRSATAVPMNSEKVIGSPIGGTTARPHCFAELTAIRRHRSTLDVRAAGTSVRVVAIGWILRTPSIVASRTTSSNLSALRSAIASVMVDRRFRRRR